MSSVAYEAVYKQIVDKMNNGEIPWRRPWALISPYNYKTKRKYSGINFLLLSIADYKDPRWFTYKQLQELGANVKKGQKSKQVIFWKIISKEDGGKTRTIPFLRYYNVFNVEQTEGYKFPKVGNDNQRIITGDDILSGYTDKPSVTYGGNVAAYVPAMDVIKMPHIAYFDNSNEFYSTLFHEMVHSTGHSKRLDRKTLNVRDSSSYSEEELVAEFGAAFLCNVAGIDNSTIDNSAAYIRGWLKAFADNPEMIVHAASKAQKAVEYILGKDDENIEEDVDN